MKTMIDRMVDRFLGWKLPKTFSPDCYVSIDKTRANFDQPGFWPIGTNLLTADEAREMFRHVIGADPTEQLCWAVRQFVRIEPAGESDDCWVRFKVGVQQFTIGNEPMPEDEASHFAGLFVFAMVGAFREVIGGVESARADQSKGGA